MKSIASITGQDSTIRAIDQRFATAQREVFWLSGPGGSGKTWVGKSVAENWMRVDGFVLSVRGRKELSSKALFPWLSAVASFTERQTQRSKASAIIDASAGVPFAGKSFREIAKFFLERRDTVSEMQTPFLGGEQREILTRIRHDAKERPVLLVCDDFQDWDLASVELLQLALAPETSEVFPFLSQIKVLLISSRSPDYETHAPLAEVGALRVTAQAELSLCRRDCFPELLSAFGATQQYGDSVLSELSDLTGNHLELVRLIAQDGFATAVDERIDGEFRLRTLARARAVSGQKLPSETIGVLGVASIIVTPFSVEELSCLLDTNPRLLAQHLEAAIEAKLLLPVPEGNEFAHKLVREQFLSRYAPSKAQLNSKFADCLAALHPGDYLRRAIHLEWGHRSADAEVLRGLDYLRSVRQARTEYSAPPITTADLDLARVIRTIAAAQFQFDAGQYSEAILGLNALEDIVNPAILLERDILAARCNTKLLTSAARHRAAQILSRWRSDREVEIEVWCRAMTYLLVAYVFVGHIDDATDVQREIERRIAPKKFDPTLRVSLNKLRLKANALHSSEVARTRLQDALAFFDGSHGSSNYDPVHTYIALLNLAANLLMNGAAGSAYTHCVRAAELVRSEPAHWFPRLDILNNNLTIAASFSGQCDADEALDELHIALSLAASNDYPLLESNRAFFLCSLGRYFEAALLLQPIYDGLKRSEAIDPYYLYFVGNNLAGSLFDSGRASDAKIIWGQIDPDPEGFTKEVFAYVKRRHQIQSTVWDKPTWAAALNQHSVQEIGPAWAFFGRAYLVSELEFWSDE